MLQGIALQEPGPEAINTLHEQGTSEPAFNSGNPS